MQIKLTAAALLFALVLNVQAQQIANLKTPISAVQLVEMPALDNEALLQAELAARAPGRAPRFAESLTVDISPETHGKWEETPAGYAIWRLRIRSAGALSLNFGFDSYHMPEGGRLFLFTPDQERILGPFTPADNQEYAQLWTPIVEGDEIVIEVQVPVAKRSELLLHLHSVNHDYLGFSQLLSGSCNLDVVCGAADGWGIVDNYRDIIQSVAVYGLGGSTFCTGFLVNTTRNDCAPYFMTADHCGVRANNAASLVVYWNFQNSVCRQPGSPASGQQGDGALDLFNTGSSLRARFSPADMTLVELSNPVPEAADAFYAGWNLSDQTPQDTVICVHHPSTDEKRISFEFDPTYPGNWGSGSQNIPTGNHIIVPDWDIGTTEGGSSGAPLFNRKKQVVGQLHGGSAACSNNLYDSYGWIFFSWTGGGTPATSLRPWLDPDNTGVAELDGRWARLCSYSIEPLIANQSVCAPDSAQYSVVVSENFEDTVLLSLSNLPAGAEVSFSSNPVVPGDTVLITIFNTADILPGTYSMTLSGTDGENSAGSFLSILVNSGLPASPDLLTPADGNAGEPIAPNFSWAAQQPGTRYAFQLATDPDFNNIVGAVADLNANSIINQVLIPNTTYYWRVRGTNVCGEGPWSEVRSFTTAVTICASKPATDLPRIIPSEGMPQITSSVSVAAPGVVAGVKITGLDVRHTWVGDLRATLISPAGTAVVLFDRLGVPGTQFGCSGDNLMLSFDDLALNTALQLENTCSTPPPAASGTFQPIDPLSALIGQPASGEWTLRVNDFVNQDGGSIQAWTLEICTSLPNEADIFPAQTDFAICAADTAVFEFGVGTAFDTGGVDLAITGLPQGVAYELSLNPAIPGSIITARIWGFTGAGNFTASITADDGSSTAASDLSFSVNTPPAPAPLLAPLPDAIRTPRSLTLTWGEVPGATAYRLWVATDSLLTNLVANTTLSGTSFALSGLEFATLYFWRVDAQNECGWSEAAPPARFTTVGDLSFGATPASISTCDTGTAAYTLNPGAGYAAPLMFSFSSSGPGTVQPQLSFSTVNNQQIATVSNLLSLSRGMYQIAITITDADSQTGEITVTLEVETAPPFPTLTAPANNAVIMSQTPLISWSPSTGADNYRLEIARDDNFSDIAISTMLSQVFYPVTQALAAGEYFWRVTAINECGNATTSPFRFTVMPNSVYEIAGVRLQINPNPTSGPVHIQMQGPAPADWIVSVYHINGALLQQQEVSRSEAYTSIDLSAHPPGVYVLRLHMGQNQVVQRIIRQ